MRPLCGSCIPPQTTVARVWARLLGQLGLRPNAEEEERARKALADTASSTTAAAAQTEVERAAAVLQEKVEENEVELKKRAVDMCRRVVDSARLGRDAADKYVAGISGFPASRDTPEGRYKDTIQREALAAQRRATEDIEDASRALQAAEAEYGRVRSKHDEARKQKQAKADAAATANGAAASAAVALASAPPNRFWELKGHELAHESDGKQTLLGIVAALMDKRLVDDTKSPPDDRRGGTILVDEAHNLDPSRTPHGRAILQYLLTIAEDNKDVSAAAVS